ncbi:nucleotidyltransferase [Spirochaetia bacterium]|nr:nucleotidyltransferase [Spirochaetia bacterium]
MKPILVVLAAGMGSRYGGLKQMDKIGAAGEALLDYSVFDALRSGFGSVVFVIRHDIEADFRDIVLKRMGNSFDYKIVFQDLDTIIPQPYLSQSQKAGRTKPWGTLHALLCAEAAIDAPFAVINADDFYGRKAYIAMGAFLSKEPVQDGAIVPYKLKDTLSDVGTVTRGVCSEAGGLLTGVEELLLIKREGKTIFNTGPDGKKRELAENTPVSMNFWGFPIGIFPEMHKYFDNFLKTQGGEQKSECYLPKCADQLIKENKLSFKILDTESEWFGVTYKEDREFACARVAELTKRGVYPAALWG